MFGVSRYRGKDEKTTATTVKVSFEKQCDTMMVTVCQPGGYGHHGHHGYGGYGASHQYCKEVAQETCYNVPMVMEDVQDVTVSYPEPVKTCVDKPISLPKVTCEDISEEKCITVPEIMDDTISVEKCEVSFSLAGIIDSKVQDISTRICQLTRFDQIIQSSFETTYQGFFTPCSGIPGRAIL